MKNIYNQNKILFFYFIYIFTGYLFFLYLHSSEFPFKYVFTDWLINYEGGYVRKGLLGQIVYFIATNTNFELKKIIFFIQSFGYVLYIVLILELIKKIELNYFWYLIFFSTIFFLYPLSELEALGRKDIYVILCFIIFTYINFNNFNNLILGFLIIFTISSLIHEITFFYIFYYLIILFIKFNSNFISRTNYKYILLTIIFYLFFLVYLNLFISQNADINKIIKSYEVLDLNLNNSFGAITWITKSFRENLINTISTISLKSIIRYSYILIINICVIIYFLRFKKQIILFSKKLKIIEIIILLVFLSLPVYLIVLDWGRIIYINYNFMIITIIFFFNQKLIDIVYLNKKIKKISFKIKIFIFIFICILFSPKILINDDFSGFPLYKSINKFQKNIRSLY